jgi:hypothetical protein
VRVFDNRHVALQPAQLVQRVRDEGSLWVAARYGSLRDLLS